MWLSRKLSQHEMQDVASAQDGTVTVEGGELAVFSSGEKREVKTAAPGGYEWQPKKGEDVLVVRGGTFGEEAYAVGAVGQSAGDLAPGEVRIRSAAAGTEIVLRKRVLFKLSVRRGSFALVPELGSKLHLLWREKGESRATAAKQYAAEALADEEGLSVTGMELAEKNGFLELRVLLRYENETGEAVVTIGGE